MSCSSGDPGLDTLVRLSTALEVGQIAAYVNSQLEFEEQTLPDIKELETGDLLVRFFGMKATDGFFTWGNVFATRVSNGLDTKASKNSSALLAPLKPLSLLALGTRRAVGTTTGRRHGVECHRGFWKVWRRVSRACEEKYGCDTIERIYSSYTGRDMGESKIVLLGHSMGGCLAAICAYQLIHRYPALADRIYIITLGSPLYARRGFASWLETNLPQRIVNLCVVGDATISLPGFAGWCAPGQRLWISSARIPIVEELPHWQYWELLRRLLLVH